MHIAPPSEFGLDNQMLYVANGTASDVKVIDVATMSIVDTIPVPDQPDGLAGLGMNWEVHGVVPSEDRSSVYAVGALSGGYLAGAPYQMYEIDAGSKTLKRQIPLANNDHDPVGYCGLEYNLNDEGSSEIIAADMNAADATLMSIGAPNLGRSPAQQVGGWSYEDIAAGTNTGFMSADHNGNLESSTCGIAWNASGDRGFAAQMFEPLVDKVSWSSRSTDGEIAPFPGSSYHQATSDKARGLMYVASSSGNVDVFDMNTNAQVGQINIRALTGTPGNDVHGVEVAPTNNNVLYVTSRNTPVVGENMELVVDVSNIGAPSLIGAVGGLADGVCGVYAIDNKQQYYEVNDPVGLNDQMLFVANGSASDVKVVDVGTMSIVDTIPVPDQPDGLIGLGMSWEVHGVVPAKDRGSVYAVGALSGGYLAGAPYQMYEVNTATGSLERQIPLANNDHDPVGYCGLEYNLNDESSSEIIAADMNAADATLMSIGAPNLLRPPEHQVGGWSYEDIAAGTNTGFMSADHDGNLESSTCGIAWSASGDRGFAAQMFQPLVDKVSWSTRSTDGEIAPFPGASYHQATSDKARGLMYVASSSGNVDVFDMNTNAQVGQINIRALTGSATNDVHGVEVAPGNNGVLYVTSRNTPDAGDNMELVIDVGDINAPVLKGSISGFTDGVCGVYAIADKGEYYGSRPALSLSKTRVYWASYADYLIHKLSIDYRISDSAADAKDVKIVGSSNTGGVVSATLLPKSIGDIAAGASTGVTLQYILPPGVTSFKTTTGATAQNGAAIFNYPGPGPWPGL